jgi:hypothetical protein
MTIVRDELTGSLIRHRHAVLPDHSVVEHVELMGTDLLTLVPDDQPREVDGLHAWLQHNQERARP